MATVDYITLEHREDNFELELTRIKQKIQTKFLELIDCLKEREKVLIRELDTILTSYHSYKRDFQKMSEKKFALERTKLFLQNEPLTSPIKSVHDNFISQLNTELESIKTPVKPKIVSFMCDNNKLLHEVNKLGKLVVKLKNGIDYTAKIQSLISVCDKGNRNEQLSNPRDVTVDNRTGNIYVTDQYNNCVKVFDNTAKYLFKFGDNKDEGKMYFPKSLAICGDRIIISQFNHCILNYQLDGKFISKIGTCGEGELEFYSPYGLTIDESNNDIYICDYSNHRVQILSKDFLYKSQFGIGTLRYPLDVKLSHQNIYVLDCSNPCIHLFNHHQMLQKSIISRGAGNQVVKPYSFFIDNYENFLIADYDSNCICIFNAKFESIHKITVSEHPTAVTADNQYRVIVVCNNAMDCLQVF